MTVGTKERSVVVRRKLPRPVRRGGEHEERRLGDGRGDVRGTACKPRSVADHPSDDEPVSRLAAGTEEPLAAPIEGTSLPQRLTPPPRCGISSEQAEIVLLQEAYREFWAGRLPDERIEEECRQIRQLCRT